MPTSRVLIVSVLFATLAVLPAGCTKQAPDAEKNKQKRDILLVTKTEGFRHASIPEGVRAIKDIASETELRITHTENAGYFQPDRLAHFKAVLFLNTTGDILDSLQQQAFRNFVGKGGGIIGVHSATDTESQWPWFRKALGGSFQGHPEIQQAVLTVADHSHPATSFLPEKWTRTDEWYNFSYLNPDINVLLKLDERTYEGGTHGEEHPIAWYHEMEGARIFYTGLGHSSESYSDPRFRRHLRGGISYVLGRENK